MGVWGGLKDIINTMNRGAHQADWTAEAQRLKEIELAEQRKNLLNAAEGRARAGEERAAEGYEYGKTRRGAAEQLEGLGIKGAELDVRGKEFNLANAPEELARLRKRQDAEDRRAERQLGLSAEQLQLAKEQAAQQGISWEEQLKDMQRKNRFGAATVEGEISQANFENSPEGRLNAQYRVIAQLLQNTPEGPAQDALLAQLQAMMAGTKSGSVPVAAKPQPDPREVLEIANRYSQRR